MHSSYEKKLDKDVAKLTDELILQQTYPPRIVRYGEVYAIQMYSSEFAAYVDVAEYSNYDSAKSDFVNWTAAWDHIKKLIISDISNTRFVKYYS